MKKEFIKIEPPKEWGTPFTPKIGVGEKVYVFEKKHDKCVVAEMEVRSMTIAGKQTISLHLSYPGDTKISNYVMGSEYGFSYYTDKNSAECVSNFINNKVIKYTVYGKRSIKQLIKNELNCIYGMWGE